MSNQLAANPFKIDTLSVTPVYLHHLEVKRIDYAGYTNANDEVEVQDQNGNIIWLGHGQDDLSLVDGHDFGWYNGLKVPVTKTDGNPNMPSGFILVHFK